MDISRPSPPSLQIMLKEPRLVPKKWEMLFRYDPAVLIIAVRWHQTDVSFGKLLRNQLLIDYVGNGDSVSTLSHLT